MTRSKERLLGMADDELGNASHNLKLVGERLQIQVRPVAAELLIAYANAQIALSEVCISLAQQRA